MELKYPDRGPEPCLPSWHWPSITKTVQSGDYLGVNISIYAHVYIWIMENEMETIIILALYRGYIGIMGNRIETTV